MYLFQLQISFVINFDTMDIKILDENGQDLFERPLEDIIVLVKDDEETIENQLDEVDIETTSGHPVIADRFVPAP